MSCPVSLSDGKGSAWQLALHSGCSLPYIILFGVSWIFRFAHCRMTEARWSWLGLPAWDGNWLSFVPECQPTLASLFICDSLSSRPRLLKWSFTAAWLPVRVYHFQCGTPSPLRGHLGPWFPMNFHKDHFSLRGCYPNASYASRNSWDWHLM